MRAFQFDSAVGWDEGCSFGFLEWLAGVRPMERVGHRFVVVGDEVRQLFVQRVHRDEAAAAQAFAVDDSEDDLDLVEPGTVFRQIDEPNAMAGIGEKFTAAGLGLQDAFLVFSPSTSSRSQVSATHSTRLADT